jgi:hypothetical protein
MSPIMPVDITLVGSIINPVGGLASDRFGNFSGAGQNINEVREDAWGRGLFLHSQKYGPDELQAGNITLATNASAYHHKTGVGAWSMV